MSDEYTPTTDEIREYVMVGDPKPWEEPSPEVDARESRRGAAFDRWLAERITQAKAEALEEFARALSGEYTLNFGSAATLHDQIVRLLKRDADIIREAVQS